MAQESIIGKIIVKTDKTPDGRSVFVKLEDVANIYLSYKKPNSFRRINGKDAITFAVLREPNSNVVESMSLLNQEIEKLNNNLLISKGLELTTVYDETIYINEAISVVKQNIVIGGILAIFVLILFLRNLKPTLIIMFAIPISVIGTFVALASLGLSINVVSLAGLAFAVGMVVDASIVSKENIFRLNQIGLSAKQAAFDGSRQVYTPIIGSALTTVVVFIPILLLDLPVGQLFRDIGIAISVSVLISALVSITLIPSMSALTMKDHFSKKFKSFEIPILDYLAKNFSKIICEYAKWSTLNLKKGLLVVVSVVFLSFFIVSSFMPSLDYLPDGNRNFVFARILVPPGYNKEATLDIAKAMENAAKPLWQEKEKSDNTKPKISRFFFVAYSGGAFAGAATEDPRRVREILPILTQPIRSQPGARAYAQQASLFGRSVGGSRVIKVNITGPSLEKINPVAKKLIYSIRSKFPPKSGHQVRSIPTLNSGIPQIVIKPDNSKLSDYGITAREFATILDVYNDGLRVSEIPFEGRLIEMTLMSDQSNLNKIEDLSDFPIVTKSGEIIALSQIANIDLVGVPNQIKRLSGKRGITIMLRPNENISLENAILILETDIIKSLSKNLVDGVSIDLSGAASELERTWLSMKQNVLIALFVIYILLTILMRSFLLPFIIIIIVPTAAAGGIMSLSFLNNYIKQPLDMMTMLGFIILSGVVVNNAILMVEQTLWHNKVEKKSINNSIIEATKNRIRPIFMSTFTSLFGLTPLVIFPGAGSELYRGIGTVVFGGLAMSTILTLFLIPPLLMLILSIKKNNFSKF